MPLIIPAIDVKSGKTYFFSSINKRNKISDEFIYENNISLGKAVRASCSYPLIFSPCNYEQTDLVDGGIRENIPWKTLKQNGADRVLCVKFSKDFEGESCKNIIDVVSNSFDILCHELSNYELNGVDCLLNIKTKNISLLDISKIDELYNIGYKYAKENIYKIKSCLINNN